MTTPTTYLPKGVDLHAALCSTRMLLALRWRMVRGVTPRIVVFLGLGLLLGLLFLASNIGFFIRQFAEQGTGSAAGIYAANYLMALQRGDLGSVGAAALGSALAASLLSAFTGVGNVSLFSGDDLTALRPNRLHRYFDAWITTAISSIGFLQLLTLTGIASLTSMEGGRIQALAFSWAIWPVLIMVSVAQGWLLELAHRTFGTAVRREILLVIVAASGVAVLLDDEHGRTLFGIGNLYSDVLAHVQTGRLSVTLIALLCVGALWLALFLIGVALCNAALSKPAVVSGSTKTIKRWFPISKHPKVALAQLLFSQVTRTMEVRRPIMTIVVLGVPAVWLTSGSRSTMTTLVLALPLAVALSWGVNTFGILGPGMTWLSSQPKLMRWLLPMITAVQLLLIAVIFALCWVPPLLGGVVNLRQVTAVAAGTVVASLITTRSAASKAVRKPYLAHLGTRGDVVVPPLAAINYALRLAVWGGQIGVLAFVQDTVLLQLALVGVAVLWSVGRYVWLLHCWADRSVQARVTFTVAAA